MEQSPPTALQQQETKLAAPPTLCFLPLAVSTGELYRVTPGRPSALVLRKAFECFCLRTFLDPILEKAVLSSGLQGADRNMAGCGATLSINPGGCFTSGSQGKPLNWRVGTRKMALQG